MIYVFLAEGFEETEAITPIDYLKRCEELNVRTVGVGSKEVTGSHGITIRADLSEDEVDIKKTEMIVLPGGMPGTLNLEKSPFVSLFIDYCAENNLPIGAICAAPSILGHKGLLEGKKATAFPGFEQELAGAIFTGAPVEKDGIFITARGAGVANQFAFKLIETLLGEKKAQKIKDSVRWAE